MSALLYITFFLGGFGFFTEFALAAPYNITSDVVAALNVGAGATAIIEIEELPDGLTAKNREKITNSIVANDLVQQVKNKVTDTNNARLISEAAKNQIAARCAAAGNTPCLPTDQSWIAAQTTYDEKNALFTDAVADLNSALTKARLIEDTTIMEMLVYNTTGAYTNGKTTELAGSAQQVAKGLGGQTVADSGNATQRNVTFSKEQQEASRIKLGNANAWNGGDQLVMTLGAACSFFPAPFGDGVNILPCYAELFYNVIYRPVSMVLRGSGMIFDYMIMLSIDNKKNMVAPGFVDEAWTVVRDFSNMLFIFVLLYTGIMTMFGMADWKKVVVKVVVVALLINFSLFFTKVVIDAGNVLAVGIMSAISVPAGATTGSLSAGLVAAFQPQQFLKLAAGADVGSAEAVNAIIVFLVATVVSGFAAYYLFKASLLFLGRLIGFWFLMIVSPFVFISTALPSGDKFKEWFGSLIGLTFAAPLFLFLMYLIMMIIKSGNGIMDDFNITGGDWSKAILGPVMVATLIIIALKKSLELTESMAGAFGKIGADMVSAAITTASVGARLGVAVASGGASLAVSGAKFAAKGGSVMGMKFGGIAKEGGAWDKMGANINKFQESKWGGRLTNAASGTGKFLKDSSFDVRNIGGDNSILGHVAGGILKQGVGALGIGKGVGEGGVYASQEKQKKIDAGKEKAKEDRILKEAASDQMSDAEKDSVRKDAEKVSADVATNLVQAQALSETAKKELEIQKAILAAVEKEESESETAKAVKELAVAYEKSQSSNRAWNTPESAQSMSDAKIKLRSAQKLHEESGSVQGLKTATDNVKKSTANLAERNKNTEEARSLVGADIDTKASWLIARENKQRKEVHIKKAEASGRYQTAAKIRKGEKGGKKSAKELVAELLEETGEKNKDAKDEPNAKATAGPAH